MNLIYNIFKLFNLSYGKRFDDSQILPLFLPPKVAVRFAFNFFFQFRFKQYTVLDAGREESHSLPPHFVKHKSSSLY